MQIYNDNGSNTSLEDKKDKKKRFFSRGGTTENIELDEESD